MRLSGKGAVITGGGSGMGRAIAVEFARQGARVVAADINEAAAEETAALVRAENGIGFGLRVDVTDSASANLMAQRALELLGSLHILVNCAGVRIIKNFLEHTDADWKRMLDINLTGPFYCARAVLPAILAAGGGKVINIASIASYVGRPNRAAYCAAKAGVLGLTRALATDMRGRNVCVNAIAPGSIATPLTAGPSSDNGVDWGGKTSRVAGAGPRRLRRPPFSSPARKLITSPEPKSGSMEVGCRVAPATAKFLAARPPFRIDRPNPTSFRLPLS